MAEAGGALTSDLVLGISQLLSVACAVPAHALHPPGHYERTAGDSTYIYIFNQGRVTDVVKERYQSAYCLLGPVACDLVNLTGYTGDFR